MIRRSLLFTALATAGLLGSLAVSAAEIKIVNQDVGTGQGLDDPTPATPVGGNPGTTVGKQALNVYQFAADIWGAVLQSDVTIVNNATFEPLSCDATSGVLGSSGTTYIFYFDDTSTLPAGAVSAKTTACATLSGSCRSSGSRSGKRSSRNGVRMPPAIRAVTLTPSPRNSACRACDRPSRPHLLA